MSQSGYMEGAAEHRERIDDLDLHVRSLGRDPCRKRPRRSDMTLTDMRRENEQTTNANTVRGISGEIEVATLG